MQKKNKFIIAIITSTLVFLVIGFCAGRILTANYFKSQLQELQGKWEEAKEHYGMAEWEMHNVSGTVTEVKGNIINVDAGLNPDPFVEWIQEREVVVTENTAIVLRERKNLAQVEKEWEEYMKIEQEFFETIEQNPEAELDLEYPEPPSEFKEIEKISIGQIEVGMEIHAEADRDIAGEKRFEAVKIFIQKSENLFE